MQKDNEGYYTSIDGKKAGQLYKRNLYNLQQKILSEEKATHKNYHLPEIELGSGNLTKNVQRILQGSKGKHDLNHTSSDISAHQSTNTNSQLNQLQKTNGFPNYQNATGSGDKYLINRSKPTSYAQKASVRLNSLKMNIGGQDQNSSPLKKSNLQSFSGDGQSDTKKTGSLRGSAMRNAGGIGSGIYGTISPEHYHVEKLNNALA